MNDVIATIGPKIRELRRQRGLSLQQLAQRSGVSAAAIHKIERNSMVPTITTLMKLAGALNRSVAWLVDEEEMVESRQAVHVKAADRKPVFTSKTGLELMGVTGPYASSWPAPSQR